MGFASFFNNNNANKGSWGVSQTNQVVNIVCSSNADTNLAKIFTQNNIKLLTNNSDINIYQFLCMTCIMLNELGGTFNTILTEHGNAPYFFNYNANIPKLSYNCNGQNFCAVLGNKSAADLFKSQVFLNVPARANMYKPNNINDVSWSSYVYPKNEPIGVDSYDSTKNYTSLGLIAECDFYKFRGRGPIQLTGRSNYKRMFNYLINNKGSIINSISLNSLVIINNWGSDSLDDIATKITNIELDTLFSDLLVSLLVFKIHPSNAFLNNMYTVDTPNNFLDLVNKYGKSIGGNDYATLFTNRVFEIIEKIPNWVTNPNSNVQST